MESKNLIVYYSYSGHTDKIAKMIHKKVGGDILKLEEAEPYPKAYHDIVERVNNDKKAGILPDLNTKVDNIGIYNKIFIGSPNWWNEMAPPVKSFLSEYDFTDKVIVPFCTHGGGGEGGIFKEIGKKCRKGEVKKGIAIYSDREMKAEKKIKDWLNDLEF